MMSSNDKKHPAHHHHHSHAHGHHHHHSHGDVFGRMRVALILNLIFACIEIVGGYLTNSMAIMSDALHDFGDVLAVALSIVLEKISHKKSDGNFSYGYRRFSTLGALITGLILIIGSVIILIQAFARLASPQQPHATGMMVLAVFGVLVNGIAAYKVSRGGSLNEKMLMWHMIEDVLGWVIVLVGSILIKFFEIPQLDAGLAIILAMWIMFNVFKNIREALQVFLMASPAQVALVEVESLICKISGVKGVHHGHLWSLDGVNHIYTAHIVLSVDTTVREMEAVKDEIKKRVKQFGIIEATLETEVEGSICSDPSHP